MTLKVDLTQRGFGGVFVTIERVPEGVRLVVDVDDPHYSGEVVLTADQRATLARVLEE
jgi:hypothetical protein